MFRNSKPSDNRPGPFPLPYVKHSRSRRITHISANITGQLIPDIILWLHDLRNLAIQIRLMLFYPQKGRKCKTRINTVMKYLLFFILRHALIYFFHLFTGALIQPDDCRAQDISLFVNSYKSMHLTGQSYSPDLAKRLLILFLQTATQFYGRIPPMVRVLFCTIGCRNFHIIFLGFNSYYSPFRIQKHGLNTGCSQVNT